MRSPGQLLTALPNRHTPYPFLVTESSTHVRVTRERPHTSQSTGNCARLNPTGARSKDVSGETCLFARGTLHVQEHGRAKTRERTGATAQPPVLGPNTLFHGKARARSAHNFPSCTDLIKMKRSRHSRPADQLEPAVRFDAGYRLYCQILSNQLSCFTGLFFFCPPSFLWLSCSGLCCTGRVLPGSWANHSHCSPCMPQTEGFHWSSM